MERCLNGPSHTTTGSFMPLGILADWGPQSRKVPASLTRTHLHEPPREKSGPRISLTVLTEPGYAGTAAPAAHAAGSGSAA